MNYLKKKICFPPSAIFQNKYQTLKIENKDNTPFYYKFSNDTYQIFRVF